MVSPFPLLCSLGNPDSKHTRILTSDMTTKLISALIKSCQNSLCWNYVSIRVVVFVCLLFGNAHKREHPVCINSHHATTLHKLERPAKMPGRVTFTRLYSKPKTPFHFQHDTITSEYTERLFCRFSENDGCHGVPQVMQPFYAIEVSCSEKDKKHPV